MSRLFSPGLIRPIPFTLALFLAAVDLSTILAPPQLARAAVYFLIVSASVTGGILFWMVVLVRGDHGLMGPVVGVARDTDLRLPKYARILFGIGAATWMAGLAIQVGNPAGLCLFVTGIALMAAASTQFRHGLSDQASPP
jgi:hypothetical protein